jgi:hypothetical protein
MTLKFVTPAALRDSFWRAFWRRQKQHLPPAANISISNVTAHMDKDATVPAFNVEVGREWRA